MRRAKGDRGSATLNLVVVFPAFLLLLLLIVQAALYFHARHVALAAAQEGLRTARLYDGTAVSGEERARSFLDVAAGNSLLSDHVRVSREAQTARVEVTGRAVSVFPGLTLHVDAVATGPIEQFTSSP
jgi:Flp pilus assembly protein TadG